MMTEIVRERAERLKADYYAAYKGEERPPIGKEAQPAADRRARKAAEALTTSPPVRRRVYNFPQCGWNCCQPGTLPQRRRNLARSETDATRGHAA
jgi:hypothetical protein